jgi:hypothetical protein
MDDKVQHSVVLENEQAVDGLCSNLFNCVVCSIYQCLYMHLILYIALEVALGIQQGPTEFFARGGGKTNPITISLNTPIFFTQML